MARLPPELHSMVIKSLRENVLTLKACSLVCRGWRKQAQTLLFRSHPVRIGASDEMDPFQLNQVGGEHTLKDFVACVQTSPYMHRAVRTVRLNITNLLDHRFTSDGDTPWTVQELLQAVNDAELRHLQTLSFFNPGSPREVTDFPLLRSLLPVPAGASLHSVTRVTLECNMDFHHLSSLQYLLCSLPSLQEFSCFRIAFGHATRAPPPLPAPLALRRVSMRDRCDPSAGAYCIGFVNWLRTTGTSLTLKSLELPFIQPTGLLTLLSFGMYQCLAPSLEELHINMSTRGNGEIRIVSALLLVRMMRAGELKRLTLTLRTGACTTAYFADSDIDVALKDNYDISDMMPALSDVLIVLEDGSSLHKLQHCKIIWTIFNKHHKQGFLSFPPGIELCDGE